jgi:predicted GIY-YIG superfamily endonuclease
MPRPRDTYRYTLRESRNVVAYGVTDNPEARLAEHQRNHPNVSMTVNGPAVTREAALEWERAQINQYCGQHDGKKPRYNKV